MKNVIHLLCLALLVQLSGGLTADEPLSKKFPNDDLSSTFLAKLQKTGDMEVVAIRISKWKAEVKTRTVTCTKDVVETRTRTVKDKNGVDVTQTYDVTIPITEQLEQTYFGYTPLPPLKGEIPLSELRAWNIKGKPLTEEELRIALAKPTYLFGLTDEPEKNQPPIDPFYASALRNDIIFVHSPKLNELFDQSIEYPPAATTDHSAFLTP